jgi:hypothetical protein
MRPRTATSLAALALAAGIGLAGAASAAPFFTLAGGVDGPDVGNDFAFINGTGAIIRESQAGNPATINITGPGNIRIEYIGKEALFSNNLFNWGALAGGLLVSDTGPNPPQTVGDTTGIPPASQANGLAPLVVPVAAGLLPFNFVITATGNVVPNGHAGPGNDDVAFFFADAAGNPLPLSGQSTIAYLLLDDGGGANDNDHDDMIVRLTITEAPEPGTLAVLGMTLAGLGLSRRRRR